MRFIPTARAALCACLLAGAATSAPRKAPEAPVTLPDIDVPYVKHVLSNGLTVLVHEDHSAPLVAVSVWYHVGSKNEPEGRSGFAHLFEHLMFNGSEHHDDEFFKLTQKIGATDQNGTTDNDRTNYFQTVPTAALDTVLWLESDRMGYLLGAVTQEKLDEQRKVVQNEKRQGENRPYAKAVDLITRATFPVGHPYAHSVIGSMADLQAARLEDVRAWFRAWYGPANAVIVLAGDITPDDANARVEKYFGGIASGEPVTHPRSWVVRRTGTQRETTQDRVAQPRLYRVWNICEYTCSDIDYLQFIGLVLAGDRNSRLYRRLVVDRPLATDVSASADVREIAGHFVIAVTARSEQDLPEIEKIVDEELRKLRTGGVPAAEMNRLRVATIASIASGLEKLGGFNGRANWLAESHTYFGSANGWKAGFRRFRDATSADLQAAAGRWLGDGDYLLTVLPFAETSVARQDVDRSAVPMPAAITPAEFPPVERVTLANGLKIVLAPRRGLPLLSMTLVVDSGIPADYATLAPGTGALTINMLKEGTQQRSGSQLAEALGNLGATLETSGGGELSAVSLTTLTSTLPQALALYAEVITQPSFPEDAMQRLKAQTLARIEAQKRDPENVVARITPRLVFGADSIYGRLLSVEGTQSIRRHQLVAFHDRWFHPGNATLVIAGDTTLAEISPLVAQAFAGWKAGDVPEAILPVHTAPEKSVVYLIDRPGTVQAAVRVALLAPPRHEGDEIARQLLNTALGGAFTSRLNMKLREEKGWTYGVGSTLGNGGRAARLFYATTSVQTDKTVDAMIEMGSALRSVVDTRKVDAEELTAAKELQSLGLASDWATRSGVVSYLVDQVANRLPPDYHVRYGARIGATSLDDVRKAAESLIGSRPLTWVVAGDLAQIEASIRKANLGEVRVIDSEGRVLR